MRTGVVIVAGGTGRRMGSDIPKQFLSLCGKPILVHTLQRFLEALPDAQVVIALPEQEIIRWKSISEEYALTGTHLVCAGGETRFESVKKALHELDRCDLVAVHDGVRPFVSENLILRTIRVAIEKGTAVPVISPDDSFRKLSPDGTSCPVDRTSLRAVQTPQVFRYDILLKAYETDYDIRFTDDASVVEHDGQQIALCDGDPQNIKITTPFHLNLAEAILKLRNG